MSHLVVLKPLGSLLMVLRGPLWAIEMEQGSAVCKASTLPTTLLLQPSTIFLVDFSPLQGAAVR